MLSATAPAKLNLYLHIHGKRSDGYHELESLVAFADIGDRLTVEPADRLRLTVDGEFASDSGDIEANLVLRAATILQQRYGHAMGAHIRLTKHLPVGAGLGGGSSDAATALRLLCRLWGIILPVGELAAQIAPLGADIPACVYNMPLVMRGIGEIITPSPPLPPMHVVLVYPDMPLATKRVYDAHLVEERLETPALPFEADAQIFLAVLEKQSRNQLQRAAIACSPQVSEVLLALQTLPDVGLVRLCGSGSCCFALFAEEHAAKFAEAEMARFDPGWWVRRGMLS